MTLPASGAIGFADVNTEIDPAASTTLRTLNDTVVRTIFQKTTDLSTIALSDGYNKSYVIPSTSAILTSGSSFTLPRTSGPKISILAIGGGGGGGGGSGRTRWSGYYIGGTGGGSGAAAYALDVAVTPGQTITYSIGGGGGGGASRDGVYGSAGRNGDAGGTTTVSVNGTVVCQAGPGGGGELTPGSNPGSAGSVYVGSNALDSTAGGLGRNNVYPEWGGAGGVGARGYTINVGPSSIGSIIGYGSYGTESQEASSTSGTVYGAGGTGGGAKQSDRGGSNARIASTAGTQGAVFLWWYV